MHDELSILSEICNRIKKSGRITEECVASLSRTFGKRALKALEMLNELKIRKYVLKSSNRVVWIAIGKTGRYRLIPAANYCDCDDFYYRVISGEAKICYHLLAQKLAEVTNMYELISKHDDNYKSFMKTLRQKA